MLTQPSQGELGKEWLEMMCAGSTNRLHFIDLSLVFDDGAVEFLLLRP